LIPPVIADTGGLLKALAATAKGEPGFPEYQRILVSASSVIVPGLVLAKVDYFLRENRRAMRRLIGDIFDSATRYEYEPPLPSDIARALELDAKFKGLSLGLVDGTVAAVCQATASLPNSDQRPPPFCGAAGRPAVESILRPSALSASNRPISYTAIHPSISPFTPHLRHSMDIHSFQCLERAKITSKRCIQTYEHTAF
jgi:hypothetical protein